MHTARNVKRSPLHERLVAANAYLRDVSGWESPGWYAPAGVKPEVDEVLTLPYCYCGFVCCSLCLRVGRCATFH